MTIQVNLSDIFQLSSHIYYFQGNKGGVSVRMDVCGVNVCFVNCHLAAHQQKIAERIEVSMSNR